MDDGTNIQIGKTLKYLGVHVEANPRLSKHISEAAAAAAKAEKAVARIMPNVGGPGQGRRLVLASVARAKLLYAAPIWAEGLTAARNRETVRRATRSSLLRISRAYRTVSTDAAEVLAALLPVDLAAQAVFEAHQLKLQGMNLTEARRIADDRAHREWQARWDQNIGWTRTLIPNIKQWTTRKHGALSYHLTQLLTGHGCFQAYLHRIGKATTPICRYCEEPDTAWHTLTECPRWTDERMALRRSMGRNNLTGTVQSMITSEETWQAAETFARVVLNRKDEDGRQANDEP